MHDTRVCYCHGVGVVEACRGPVPVIILEHLAGRTKWARGPDPARGPCLARGCLYVNVLHLANAG